MLVFGGVTGGVPDISQEEIDGWWLLQPSKKHDETLSYRKGVPTSYRTPGNM